MRANVEGYAGPLTVSQFKGGQSNPTYRLDTPGARLCAAPQAVRQAAAVGARGGPRVPGDLGAACAGLSGARPYGLCTRRGRHRRHVLRHGHGGGPRVLGPDAAGGRARGAAADLRGRDRDAGAAAQLRSGSDRARRLRQAGQLFRPPGRALDASSTAPPRPRRSTRWTG